MKSSSRTADRFLFSAIVLLLVIRVHLLLVRVYDPDEFEHIHAGFRVAAGEVPYRDFFEHHGPLTYWVSAALVQFWGASIDLLAVHRVASLVLSFMCVFGTWMLGRALYGHTASLLAVVAMLSWPSFVEKQVEWRPDTIAVAFIPWAAWFLVREDRSPIRVGFIAGLLLGSAILATQKSIFLALGLALGAAITRRSRGESVTGQIAAGCIGVALPWVVASTVLWQAGALHAAYRCLIEVPWNWPVRTAGTSFLLARTAWSPGHQVVGVVGLALAANSLRSRNMIRIGIPVMFLGIVLHLFGLVVLPAVYFQYWMLGVPLVAILAVGEIWTAVRHRRENDSHLDTDSAPVSWIIFVIVGLGLSYFFVMYFLSHGLKRPRDPYSIVDAYTLIAVIACALLFAIRAISIRQVTLSVLVILFIPAIGRLAIPHFYWPNDSQKRIVELVNRLVSEDQPVLDGFQGFGFLRPHVTYWWWINEHTIPMIQRNGATTEIRHLVTTGVPALVIRDRNLQLIIPTELLMAHYVPIGGDLWLRRDLIYRIEGIP